ncbi:hypothetical protein B0I21_11710 [Sphingobacterium paludis]|uniref:Uncharacterized protein n=1 Tax=Sphingobacterium paludis TaxID=1476465 RepID=A0A4V3E0T7_9SPHI|nr:hypothetical protein B0I21_11710 [Sphingobacterium paludis]
MKAIAIQWIDKSFMSNELKDKYKMLVDERHTRIENHYHE